MGLRFGARWLMMSLVLSVVLMLIVRALTGIWFLGFFLFLPLGFAFGSKRRARSAPTTPSTASSSPSAIEADTFDPTPYTQGELRMPGDTFG